MKAKRKEKEEPRRLVAEVDTATALKIKTRAFNARQTMKQYLSELITKALKE